VSGKTDRRTGCERAQQCELTRLFWPRSGNAKGSPCGEGCGDTRKYRFESCLGHPVLEFDYHYLRPHGVGFSAKNVRTLSNNHRQFAPVRENSLSARADARVEFQSATDCQGFVNVTERVLSATEATLTSGKGAHALCSPIRHVSARFKYCYNVRIIR
jgi:hypothetical protein